MPKTQQRVAITPGGPITQDMLVGYYALYGVPELHKSAVTIKKHWRAAGLPEDRMPGDRQKVHVAQEAIRSVAGDMSSNGTRRRVIVDDVAEDSKLYVGQATLQQWDKASQVIEYEKSLRIVFDKKQGDFDHFDPLDPVGAEHLRGIEERIREHFESHATRIPGSKIRVTIRHLLEEEARAENVSITKRSAIYFVEAEHKGLLDGITQFLEAAYPAQGQHAAGGLHTIPVVNDEGQREWLKARFLSNAEEELQGFRDRLLDLLRQQESRKQGFRSDLIHNLQQQRREIFERRERFKDLLGDTLTELDQSSKLADQALTRLLRAAEV